jgi:hypothetical protein
MIMSVASALGAHRRLVVVAALVVVVAVTAGTVSLCSAARADRRKDAQVKVGLTTIQTAIYSYAKAHHMYIPPSDKLMAADLSTYLRPEVSWPVNPFTGRPMQTGTGPGDVRYRPLGIPPTHAYTIDSVGTDGHSVW